MSAELDSLLVRRRRALGSHAEISYDRPVHVSHAEGVWVHTIEGEKLLDVYNNVPHVGHAHPRVVAAIAQQASRIASNTRYLDDNIIRYAERLLASLPGPLDTCLFVNSGSEANDLAWRLAKAHTGFGGALVLEHSYHGITEAVTALSTAVRQAPAPHVEQLRAPPANSASEVHDALNRLGARGFKPAAFFLDSALTSSGIHDPPAEWVQRITRAVHAAGGLIVADEVQIGLGRSGSHLWGFERRGMQPDIVTLGKPIGNGYPLGAVLTSRRIAEPFQKRTGFFSTFGGNPVAAAAGLAVLESEGLMANAQATGTYLRERLQGLALEHPALQVRGCGLLVGVEIADQGGRSGDSLTRTVVNGLRERQILIGAEGPRGNVLKLRPPLPFARPHADQLISALAAELSAARARFDPR